jgi:hypothetical protein
MFESMQESPVVLRSFLRRMLAAGVAGLMAAGLSGPSAESLPSASLHPSALRPTNADYATPTRRPDGRADIERMVSRLKELGVGTYYWLVQPNTDWEDLKLFLPKAGEAGLQVWVYLVPPSENGAAAGEGPKYPAPYLSDYVRWGEEIAKLSLLHTNLTGWVIDDFDGNLKFYTPDYVSQMQARAKGINPHLAFLPLTYFGCIKPFVADYRNVIDGVVVAYPQDRPEIEQAWALLNDADEVLLAEMNFPGWTSSKAGDFAMAAQTAAVLKGPRQMLRFSYNANPGWNSPPPSGYHIKQLMVDGAVVWEEDVADTKAGWQDAVVDVTTQANGRTNLTVAFRLFEKKGVGNYGAHWRLANLRCEGLQLPAGLDQPGAWRVRKQGAFETGFGATAQRGGRRFRIPFVVMTAAQPCEFKGRHGRQGTPEDIAKWLEMCLKAQRDGRCDAVVTYCLDKSAGSRAFDLCRDLFKRFSQ